MGGLLSLPKLKEVIFEKIYSPCGINQELLNQLSQHNQHAVVEWTRLELARKEKIYVGSEYIEQALKNINLH